MLYSEKIIKCAIGVTLIAIFAAKVSAECNQSKGFVYAMQKSLKGKTNYSFYHNNKEEFGGEFVSHRPMGRLLSIELMTLSVVDNIIFIGSNKGPNVSYTFAKVGTSTELFSEIYRHAKFDVNSCSVSWSMEKDGETFTIVANANPEHTTIHYELLGEKYFYKFY